MTYSAPELLLVGAAQNLVLGLSIDQTHPLCAMPPDPGTLDYDYLGNW